MAEAAGALAVRIGADVSDLISGFHKAGKETDLFAKSITRIGATVAVAAAALAAIVKSSADAADELGKLAQKTGVSVEALSELKYAGQLADVSLESLSTGLKKLAKNMVDAQGGTGDANQAFKALGISVTDSSGKLKSSEEVFKDVADAFEGMKDGAGKTALAMAIFGKSGADLIPLLNEGRAGLKSAADEAARFGVVVSADAAKQAQEFNDNMTRLTTALAGFRNEIANEIIPKLIEMQNELLTVSQIAGGFWKGVLLQASINPFREIADNIRVLSAELEDLEKRREKWAARGGNTKHYDDEIDKLQKKLAILRYMEQVEARKDPTNAFAQGVKVTGGGEKVDAPVIESKEAAEKRKREEEKREEEIRDAKLKASKEAAEGYNKQEYDKVAEIQKLRDDDIKKMADNLALAQRVQADNNARELAALQLHQENLQKIRDEFDPEAAELESFERRKAMLASFTEYELGLVGGKQAALEKMEGQHIVNLSRIRKAGDTRIFEMTNSMREGDLQSFAGYATELTAGLAQHNKKMFELNKAAATASAIVNAFKGIALSLSEYAWPWNLIAGAAHAAVAFAQVQAIQSQTFQGGGAGAAPSLAGSSAATPVSDVGSGGGGNVSRQNTVINLHGDFFGREQVRGLMERINEEGRDGGRIVIVDRP